MKTIITAAVLVLLASCSQVAGFSGGESSATTDDSSEVIRDLSINESNAYSDLFLDSNAIEAYIQKEKLSDSTARHLRNFYAVRNNQYAWFTSQGFTEQARGLWGLYRSKDDTSSLKDGTAGGDADFHERMDTLLQQDTLAVARSDSNYVATELALTHQLIQYASAHPEGAVNLNTLYQLVPAKRMETMQLADSVLHKQKDSARFASNKQYSAMKQQLALYYEAANTGGWQPVSASGLKKGSRSPAVAVLKKRLKATGDYIGADTTDLFSDSLATAIREYQQRNGLKPTGEVSDSMVAQLNVPAKERVQQILINLNRMQWMSAPQDSNYLQVNIPSFMLYAYEGSNRALEMPVIVGEEGSGTVMFSGAINEIIFNPYWNIPQRIVRDELMPKMKSDPGYLKSRNMEIVKQSDSIPTVRQLPGPDNALGQVKFLFPNSFDIYLHDTPHKDLFKQKDRALSHGCIRVENAPLLAGYLLRGQQGWDTSKVKAAMDSRKEQRVELQQAQPVLISYYTAWVDEKGRMNFRPDVYGHDERARGRMFL